MAKEHKPHLCYDIGCKSKSHDNPEYSLFYKRVNRKGS